MTIKKFIGKTEDEATSKAKQELGSQCVIMNVRQIKPTGLFKAFKSSSYEVTAAIEEKEYRDSMTQSAGKMSESGMAATTGKINLAANENIQELLKDAGMNNVAQAPVQTPIRKVQTEQRMQTHQSMDNLNGFEERLSNLQNMLEERLTTKTEAAKEIGEEEVEVHYSAQDRNLKFMKMIYNTLLDNEVDEVYANNLLDEIEKSLSRSMNIDLILSNVYQKMILKFGQPSPIDLSGKKPKIIFLVGPTGVGKTTTLAKIASKLKIESGKKVGLLTADTYRIATEEQLRTYANILAVPLTKIYSPDELVPAIEKVGDSDVILVDTTGFSHKCTAQKEDIRALINSLPEDYEKEVFLVLSATTKYRDLIDIADTYKDMVDYKLLFTKLDETSTYGNLYNLRMYTKAELSYVTMGQNVPDDIEVFDTQKVVKKLLGGK